MSRITPAQLATLEALAARGAKLHRPRRSQNMYFVSMGLAAGATPHVEAMRRAGWIVGDQGRSAADGDVFRLTPLGAALVALRRARSGK